jgi:hypothetical protein
VKREKGEVPLLSLFLFLSREQNKGQRKKRGVKIAVMHHARELAFSMLVIDS